MPDNITVSGDTCNSSAHSFSIAQQRDLPVKDVELSNLDKGKSKPLRDLDCSKGCFRHAANIEPRVKGLYISRDTVLTLLQSVDYLEILANKTLNILPTSNALKLSASDLYDLERLWTGEIGSDTVAGQTETFHSRIIYRTFLSGDWDQVREITFLAVSDDAIRVLFKVSGRRFSPAYNNLPPPSGSLSRKVEDLLSASISFNLRAAISRVSMIFHVESRTAKLKSLNDQRIVHTSVKELVLLNTSIDSEKWGKINEIYDTVREVHRRHTAKGMRLTMEPYIRSSSRDEEQTESRPGSDEGPFTAPGELLLNAAPPECNNTGYFVLLTATSDNFCSSSICLYKLGGPTGLPSVSDLLLQLDKHLRTKQRMHKTLRSHPENPPCIETWNICFEQGMSQNEQAIYVDTISHENGPLILYWINDLLERIPGALLEEISRILSPH